MGFSTLRTTLIQMPSGAVQLVICPLAWYAVHIEETEPVLLIKCKIQFLRISLR